MGGGGVICFLVDVKGFSLLVVEMCRKVNGATDFFDFEYFRVHEEESGVKEEA